MSASTIDTIQKRGYVRAQSRQLVPTFTAMAVTRLLEETMGKVVDVEFTASMESWLDTIAVSEFVARLGCLCVSAFIIRARAPSLAPALILI